MRYSDTTNAKSTQGNLDVALAWAGAGVPIFPARANNKRPHITRWQDRATTDTAQLRRWWRKWPDAMPAIPTGSRSGIAVLDLDRKNGKDGFKTLRKLGHDPDALSPHRNTTPSNGGHLFFRHMDGLRLSTDKIGPGVDVRADGGLVIAPGTINGKGTYSKLRGPLKRVLADLPEWPATIQPPERDAYEGSGEPTGLSFEEFAAALMAVPNDDSNADASGRDWWVKMLAAVHHETDGSEEGLELVQDWSAQHDSYDEGHTEDVWRSFLRGEGATGATVLREARRHGWGVDEDRAAALAALDSCWTMEELAEIGALDEETRAAIEELVGPLPNPSFFRSASEWAGQPVPERKWHVPDLIPGNTVTILGDDGGTGKSLLALQLAVATSTRTKWLGRSIATPGKAVVLCAEDDEAELHIRMAGICRAQGLSLYRLDRLLIRSVAGEETLLAVPDKSNVMKPTKLYNRICEAIERHRPTLLVLDTLADLHAGNENDRAHARQFIGMLRHIAIQNECAVVLLAHPSLTGMNTGTGLSGSTAWNASVRSRLYLRRDKDEDGKESDPDARVLQTMKSNYGRTGEEINLTYLEGAFFSDREEGKESVLNSSDRADRVFLKLLRELSGQGRTVSPKASVTYAPKVFADHPESEGLGKKALTGAMERLLYRGEIEVGEDGPPSKRRVFLREAEQ